MTQLRLCDENVSLDTFRENPGMLFPVSTVGKACHIRSYDGLHRAMKKAGIRPLRVGRQMVLEGRVALRLIGAPATIPDPESGGQAA
jgi:hypothetical protein